MYYDSNFQWNVKSRDGVWKLCGDDISNQIEVTYQHVIDDTIDWCHAKGTQFMRSSVEIDCARKKTKAKKHHQSWLR